MTSADAALLPLLAVAPGFAAALLVALSGRWPNLREAWSLGAALAQSLAVAAMVPATLAGEPARAAAVDLAPGVALALRADALGLVFAGLSSGLWLLTTVYSVGYVRSLGEHAQTRYFACFATAVASAVGVALSANLLTFFLFYEILTLATWPLVIHKETPEALRAGRVYLGYTLGAGAALLAGIAWVHRLAGTLDFVPGGLLPPGTPAATVWGVLGLLLLGVGVKAAVMPLHAWLPLAMIAPTPVSALLHAVAVVKAGVFGTLRVVGYVVGPEAVADSGAGAALAALAGATILLASLAALAQDNLKRLLAYSTVSQLSYIVLGAALGTREALTGAVQHMVNHGSLKITLFFCAGAIYVATGRERVSELGGLGHRLPLTMGIFAVAALGLAGVPPAAGFLSKWYLIGGAVEGGAWPAVLVLLLSSLLNLAYFVPIVVAAFFGPLRGGDEVHEPSPLLVAPLAVTAAAGVLLGLWPDAPLAFLSLARRAAGEVLGPP
jgi:multicomponent Na+:H+ antiporter subunit D